MIHHVSIMRTPLHHVHMSKGPLKKKSLLCFWWFATVSVRRTSHSDVAQGEKKRGATSSVVTSPHPLHLSVSNSGSANTATSCNHCNHGISSHRLVRLNVMISICMVLLLLASFCIFLWWSITIGCGFVICSWFISRDTSCATLIKSSSLSCVWSISVSFCSSACSNTLRAKRRETSWLTTETTFWHCVSKVKHLHLCLRPSFTAIYGFMMICMFWLFLTCTTTW